MFGFQSKIYEKIMLPLNIEVKKQDKVLVFKPVTYPVFLIFQLENCL
jgi:hypothetical protein